MAVEAPEYENANPVGAIAKGADRTRKVREAYAYLDSVSKENEAQSGGEDSGGAPTGISDVCQGEAQIDSGDRHPIGYVQYCGTNKPSSRAFTELYARLPQMEHLIIDIRGNGRGNEAVLIDGVLKYLVRERVETFRFADLMRRRVQLLFAGLGTGIF